MFYFTFCTRPFHWPVFGSNEPQVSSAQVYLELMFFLSEKGKFTYPPIFNIKIFVFFQVQH